MALVDPNLSMLVGGFAAMLMAFILVFFIIAVALYVYTSLALMAIAKRTKTEDPWLAWIPIGNLVLMSRIAKMPWWPVLLIIGFIVPILNIVAIIAFAVYYMIWMWKICEIRKRPGWWAVIQAVPFVGAIWGLIMLGILAWAKD